MRANPPPLPLYRGISEESVAALSFNVSTRFGFITPIDAIPTPDLAVPYAAMAFKKIDRHAAANVRGAGYIMTAAREQRTHLLQYSQTPGPL